MYKTTRFPILVLDLDGTLINSSPTILQGFGKALEAHGIVPIVPLTDRLIGPPLKDTLTTLTGIHDPEKIEALANSFRDWYDNVGYQHTVIYDGIPEALNTLTSQTDLYIATNKRLTPTLKIIDHLGWTPLFKAVYALDSQEPAFTNKSAMIAGLLLQHNISPEQAFYVGDTPADMVASSSCNLRFIAATWGYGDFATIECKKLQRPQDLLQLPDLI